MKKTNKLIAFSILAAAVFMLSACGSAKPNVNDNMTLPKINNQAEDPQSDEAVSQIEVGDLSVLDNPGTIDSMEIDSKAQIDNNPKKENLNPEEDKDLKTANDPLPPDQQENLLSQYSRAIIQTSEGDIQVKLYNSVSPVTVNNFLNLAKSGFYNGTLFHRVMKDFMIQGGDPYSRSENWAIHGTGHPGYNFADEFNDNKLVAGSLAMANSGPNTNGSQFFIVTAAATPWLDGVHTNFGEVVSGMDVVRKIEATEVNNVSHPLDNMIIKGVKLMK